MEGELVAVVTKGHGDDHGGEPIRDSYNMAYTIHFVLGVGNLLPWNTFITAVDYFGHLYPSKHINKVFSVVYMGSSLLVLVLMMSWSSWCWMPNFRCRMNMGLVMFALSLITIPLIDWICVVDGSLERVDATYRVTVAAVTVCGLADGLVGGSLIGFAGKLPKRYMQAIFSGTASSGVLVCIFRIITKASLPRTPQGLRASIHLYFAVGTFIMLVCIICCNIVDKLLVVQHYKQKAVPGTHISHFPDYLPSSPTMPSHVNEPMKGPKFWHVAKEIRSAALGILTIYTVTLSIFPGFITDDVESNLLQDWYPILLITMYNVSDLVGKSLPAIYAMKSIGKASWASMARLLFYPLFTACLHGPKWLRTEVPVVFLTAALGLTNGYFTSVLMMLAPKSVPAAEAETAGIVMAMFLCVGLVAGSVLGWFWII
ncbi:hypothetical protein Sjap_019269 [Stephania japonica]|uniref:Equilibrative nucleoside transporter n=1 Tax=Stephania japonica TaxID=461633 RepID=A0AAP0HZC3_9MAGN